MTIKNSNKEMVQLYRRGKYIHLESDQSYQVLMTVTLTTLA